MSISKYDGSGTEISLTPEVAGPTVVAGAALDVKVLVTGSSPTAISVKVWPAAGTEPSAWTQSVSDSSAGIQGSGTIGVSGYLGRVTTNGPITASVGPVTVTAP